MNHNNPQQTTGHRHFEQNKRRIQKPKVANNRTPTRSRPNKTLCNHHVDEGPLNKTFDACLVRSAENPDDSDVLTQAAFAVDAEVADVW